MKLYNSLSRKAEEIMPIQDGQVGLYTCGPTVYDHVHIGNLRTYINEDILRRTLKANGLKVKHVMNITDIEDKIFARSKETNKPYKELTSHFEKVFLDDVKRVGIDLSESTLVRASEAIEDMQQVIIKIPNKYVAEDGIYFDIAKYPEYGVFVKLDRSHSHHRINNDEYDKEHVADFALWKAKQPDEPSWDFEVDGRNIEGRPGWHIECSAMSAKHLGQPFDIHTGGVDLKFPHHENEVAQSHSASGKKLANYWVHSEHLLVDGKKMSKSLKNFYTLADVIDKGFDPLALRLLVLQAHYRTEAHFTWDNLEAAQNRLNDYRAMAALRWQPRKHLKDASTYILRDIPKQFAAILANDLDTPGALSLLSNIATQLGALDLDSENANRYNNVQDFTKLLEFLDDLLGLKLMNVDDISDEQKDFINQREKAREDKDWTKADELRKQLEEAKIGLNDTDHGVIWYPL